MAESLPLKTCTKCGKEKLLSKFDRQAAGKHGRRSVCKKCRSKSEKERYLEHGEEIRERRLGRSDAETRRDQYREYANRPEVKARKRAYSQEYEKRSGVKERKAQAAWKNNLKRNYGITVEEYDRMLIEQQGRCKICGRLPGGKRLSTDHDHETGKVRGLLCSQCNQLIGLAYDEPVLLRLVALYLEENG